MLKRVAEVKRDRIGKGSLEERLQSQPELRARFERMLDIIENAGGDVEKAAEAERRVIEELRQMGSEVLHGWARRQEQKKEAAWEQDPGVNRKVKKNSIGTRGSEKSKSRNRSLRQGVEGR